MVKVFGNPGAPLDDNLFYDEEINDPVVRLVHDGVQRMIHNHQERSEQLAFALMQMDAIFSISASCLQATGFQRTGNVTVVSTK